MLPLCLTVKTEGLHLLISKLGFQHGNTKFILSSVILELGRNIGGVEYCMKLSNSVKNVMSL